jgi:hypothetical protein
MDFKKRKVFPGLCRKKFRSLARVNIYATQKKLSPFFMSGIQSALIGSTCFLCFSYL